MRDSTVTIAQEVRIQLVPLGLKTIPSSATNSHKTCI